MWLSVLCPHTCIHAHTLSRVQAKKVREITISEAVSGNSGLVGEGDKDGVRETDSSDMGLNKLIESVSQAMQGMEGTAGRKGARGKTGKKKKRSGDNGSCPAMSTDGGSAPSRDSGGVSASGIGVGDGGGGGGDGKGGEGCGDYDAHFPFAPAPAAGTGREGGRIAERKRASDDRLSFIAAAAESVLLSPGVKSRDWSRGQMDNRVGGGGQGQGQVCGSSSLLFLASPQSSSPPCSNKEINCVDFNGGVPGDAPASPSLASLPPPPPTSRDATTLPKVESEFVRDGFGVRTRGLHVGEEAVAAAVGKSSDCSNGGVKSSHKSSHGSNGGSHCLPEHSHISLTLLGSPSRVASPLLASRFASPKCNTTDCSSGGEQAGAVLQGTNQDDCLENNIGICPSLTCTAAAVRSHGLGVDGRWKIDGDDHYWRSNCGGRPNGMHASGCQGEWCGVVGKRVSDGGVGDDVEEVVGIDVVGAVRVREVQAAGTGKEWKDFLRNHCNGLLVDVSLSPVERFLAASESMSSWCFQTWLVEACARELNSVCTRAHITAHCLPLLSSACSGGCGRGGGGDV